MLRLGDHLSARVGCFCTGHGPDSGSFVLCRGQKSEVSQWAVAIKGRLMYMGHWIWILNNGERFIALLKKQRFRDGHLIYCLWINFLNVISRMVESLPRSPLLCLSLKFCAPETDGQRHTIFSLEFLLTATSSEIFILKILHSWTECKRDDFSFLCWLGKREK